MNRRALLTGVAALAVWPMAIRPRMRRDLRVVTPEMFGAPAEEPLYISTTLKTYSGRLVEYIHRIDLAPEIVAEEEKRIMST